MYKKSLITLFIMLHVGFIFLQIYKQSSFTHLLYQQQQHESLKQELIDKKNNLTAQLYHEQQLATISAYAQKELGMKKISLLQLKPLPT